jgi:hypothetical protein
VSTYRAVKNHGSPYFAFTSASLGANAQALPEDGLTELVVQFSVHALPKALASSDECHPLIAFGDLGKPAPAKNVMAIGVSPSGRIVGTTQFGDVVQSPSGIVTSSGEWHTARLDYDNGAQTLRLRLQEDPLTEAVTSPTASSSPALPTHNGLLMLFNGIDAIANMRVSIRSAAASFFSTLYGAGAMTFNIDDPTSAALVPVLAGTTWAPLNFTPASWTLYPTFYNPSPYAPLWGTVPSTDPNSEFNWDVLTPYVKRVMPTTQYRKVMTAL